MFNQKKLQNTIVTKVPTPEEFYARAMSFVMSAPGFAWNTPWKTTACDIGLLSIWFIEVKIELRSLIAKNKHFLLQFATNKGKHRGTPHAYPPKRPARQVLQGRTSS